MIGLVAVDSIFPNYALMKISAYHKSVGDKVEWASPLFGNYDIIYMSKIFTFSEDERTLYNGRIVRGGTGYDIHSTLPTEIEKCNKLDYSIYPNCNFSLVFFSRGCIRKCPFCLVSEKEGNIRSVDIPNLNPQGEWIEVLDNNFFANPNWKDAVKFLIDTKQKINLHGVDIRIMNEEQAYYLNKLRLKNNIHIAWDLPNIDLDTKLQEVIKYINPNKMTCYVLVGYNSTIEQDLHRLNTLKKYGITPFVMPYRDYKNERVPSQYEKDIARWANRRELFCSMNFEDYKPRKGFTCKDYLK